jgi:adenylyltransferase/sulfurtransferase
VAQNLFFNTGSRRREIASLNPAEVTRYARQMSLENWGRQAQERLKSSRALLAGAGGLAAAAAIYLLAGGLGRLRLVDGSRVGLSDLNHQILFRERDLGKAKAQVAHQRLQEINSFALVESHVKTLSEHNLARLAADCSLLLDASNLSQTGLLLNKAAAKFDLPLVHAWVWGMNGRVTTFWPGQGPCLACASLDLPSPVSAALLGPLPGIMGSLQAFEALRILGGLGPALLGRVLTFKGDNFQFTEKLVRTDPRCPVCAPLRPKSE